MKHTGKPSDFIAADERESIATSGALTSFIHVFRSAYRVVAWQV